MSGDGKELVMVGLAVAVEDMQPGVRTLFAAYTNTNFELRPQGKSGRSFVIPALGETDAPTVAIEFDGKRYTVNMLDIAVAVIAHMHPEEIKEPPAGEGEGGQ